MNDDISKIKDNILTCCLHRYCSLSSYFFDLLIIVDILFLFYFLCIYLHQNPNQDEGEPLLHNFALKDLNHRH